MTSIRAKTPRLTLDPENYRQLHRQILERDGWRCQLCGTMSNLEVHHREFRSHSGADSEDNLIRYVPTATAYSIELSCSDRSTRICFVRFRLFQALISSESLTTKRVVLLVLLPLT